MMNLEDYALDVGKSVEEIMDLCDSMGIPYQDATTTLTDEEIILLDNKLQDSEDYEESELSMDEDYEDEEEVIDKAEELAKNTKFDLDNSQSFEKVKPKKSTKVENTANTNKKDFLKERKKMYKNREKLQSNEQVQDKNVILYKEGMTVTELATSLEIAPIDLVKKLM